MMNKEFYDIAEKYIAPKIKDVFYKLYDELHAECNKIDLTLWEKAALNKTFRGEWEAVLKKEEARLEDLNNRGIDWLDDLFNKEKHCGL